MWAWVVGGLAAVLWGWALHKAWGVMVGTGRSIENEKVGRQVAEMYVSEAEVLKLIEQWPDTPAYAIKHAGMAGENWPELKLRATGVLKRFPHLIFGYTMLARAMSELGEHDAARPLIRRGLRRFPRDVQLGAYASDQAAARGDVRTALRIIRRLRLEHDAANWLYAKEVELLIPLKRFAEAEKALNEADVHLPDDPMINEAWARLEAAVAPPA